MALPEQRSIIRSVSLADMPCMCQEDAQPTLGQYAAEAFEDESISVAHDEGRLLLNGRQRAGLDAAVRAGDTVELRPGASGERPLSPGQAVTRLAASQAAVFLALGSFMAVLAPEEWRAEAARRRTSCVDVAGRCLPAAPVPGVVPVDPLNFR